MAGRVIASGLTADRTFAFPDANGTILTSLTTSITLTQTALGVVSTDGLVLQNTTATTSGVPVQQSPRLRLRSHVWNTTATAADNTDDWLIESVPASGAVPTGLLKFGSSLNGGATTYPMTLSSVGALTLLQNITTSASGGYFAVPSDGHYYITSRFEFNSPANAQLNLLNASATGGVGFDIGTDAVLKVRTRAQTGYATVDALGYSVSGAAGASKAAGPVTSITVVNGIVTAIS